MRAGEDTLRRSIAAAPDGRTRARLRVDLAELLRARDDAPAARAELDHAAREGGATAGLVSAALSLARALAPTERIAWLGGLARVEGKTPQPALASALADAQLDADLPRDAALTWMELARDERVPAHHRRAAARKAARLSHRLEPLAAAETLSLAANLAVGRGRRGPLPGPRDGVKAIDPDKAVNGSGPAAPVRPSARAPSSGPAPARRQRPARPDPATIWERALADVRAGQVSRGRRLGEEAIRASSAGPELAARVAALDAAMREGGFVKDALRLRRTHLEALDGATARPALLALASEADDAGLRALARQWRTDAGVVPTRASAPEPVPSTPEGYFLAAQRRLARDGRAGFEPSAMRPEGQSASERDANLSHVLAQLEKALAGHPGAEAALALAETLVARVASDDADLARRRLDLLRTAHAAEFAPARRARLGRRLASTLEAAGDPLGAVAVLEGALAEMPPGEGEGLRAERARILRGLGRARELSTALEKDAAALQGEARLDVLAEHATLLEAAGESEKALDVRLVALAEFPGAPSVLDDARRRLESTGREAESLALAIAALDHTNDTARRRQLLREVASLTEQAPNADAAGTAAAWLAVVAVDPDDFQAASAAERFLIATGDWERCADLLAWSAARASAGQATGAAGIAGAPSRPALLWRLAELRRARLGQTDEALRIYVELAAAGTALPPLADPPALTALVRRDPWLAVQTARAVAAPSAAERSRALLDRGLALAERERGDEAERDVLAALDCDPRNMEALAALEKMFEDPARARTLAEELGRRAVKLDPTAAAPLFFGRGRASARAGDNAAAREAYRRAMSLDPTLAEPIAALGALAAREGDWSEVAKLLESEVGLAVSPARRAALRVELAVVYGDRLNDPARAVALLDEAAAQLRDETRVLDLRARFNLAAGSWQAAAEALDQLATRSAAIPDAAARYFAVGAAAEAAGDPDRALSLYSRSYSRDTGFRPTLERLSAICFQRGQWDNAWKATEALLDRHGAALEGELRATLLARSAFADLHVGQRTAAVAKLGELVTRGPSYSPETGIRDVAESWAGMHMEPRLLVGLETRRRERIVRRAREALATDGASEVARRQSLEMLGALAVVEARWEEAIAVLEALAGDPAFEAERRAGFLVAAGDVMMRRYGDPELADPFYVRARELWPGHPRFGSTSDTAL